MIRGKRLAYLLAYLYFASYVTRINLAAIIQEVIADTGFEKSAISVVLVCLSVAYGLGQIINGYIGDKTRPQNLILVGLCTATLVNLLFPLCRTSIPLMCVLWAVNGFAQAMMWPPMVKIMVSTMDERTYGFAVVAVSLGSSVGTIAVYLSAPLIIRFFTWEVMMYVAAGFGAVSALLWCLLKDRCYPREVPCPTVLPIRRAGHSFRMPRQAILPFTAIALAITLQGMIRDGVTAWMPTYLSENFHFESDKSIFLTLSLALFSMIAFSITGYIYKKCFKNEVAFAALLFGLALLGGLVLLGLFNVGGAVIAVAMMALITGMMHGVNLMLVSHVPKRFQKYGGISTMSGLVNSFTYVGTAITTYGVAKLSEAVGWRVTVAAWVAILAAGTLACLIAAPRWKRFMEE